MPAILSNNLRPSVDEMIYKNPETINTKVNDDSKAKLDQDVWLRSCEKEIIEPIEGEVSGNIPKWLNGSLLRNGPGNWKVGDMTFQHLFDCSGLLHRFSIKNGKVTYQNRFIQTETLKKNTAAQRIVVTEFGTASVPDPCHSIFKKVSSIFKPEESSDNAMISIYPFGDEYYAFTEAPYVHKCNPKTLETEGRVCLTGIINHTSHPHVMKDGTVYNQGMAVTKNGLEYQIMCFPHGENMFENVHVVGSVTSRWKLHPSYMHTFGVTENYFIIVEQPFSVSVPTMLKTRLLNEPFAGCLKWFEKEPTLFHVLDRKTGQKTHTFQSETFFYLHTINQYEEDDHIVMDIICYKDPGAMNSLYLESMVDTKNKPEYGLLIKSRPLRFVLPLKASTQTSNKYENLVTLSNSEAEAYKLPQHENIIVRPEIICYDGCETPRFNYERCLAQKYRYFYAIGYDADAGCPGTLIKADTQTKTTKKWYERDCYPSEPIFVPSPDSKDEDDGVILSSLVWAGGDRDNCVGLLVLCAKNLKELGRCEFRADGPVPKCLHGWFAKNI